MSALDGFNWQIEEHLSPDSTSAKAVWSTPLQWPTDLQIGSNALWRSLFCSPLVTPAMTWFLKRDLKKQDPEPDETELKLIEVVAAAGQKLMKPIPLLHPQLSNLCITDSTTSPDIVRQIFDDEVEASICALLNQIPKSVRTSFQCEFDKTNLMIETPALQTGEELSLLIALGAKIAVRARCFEGETEEVMNIEPFLQAAQKLPPEMRSELLAEAPPEIQQRLHASGW